MELTKENVSKIAQDTYDQILEIERDEQGNPLTLEGCIRSVILKCPSMCKWRDDALNIMYCTLGAGLDWDKEGKYIISRSPNNYTNLPPKAPRTTPSFGPSDFGMSDSLDLMDSHPLVRERIEKMHLERVQSSVDAVLDIDNRCKTYRSNRTHWYPISWYCPNMAAPFTAQEDFFQGAIETAILVSTSDLDWMHDTYWRNTQRAKEVAIDILKILLDNEKRRNGS